MVNLQVASPGGDGSVGGEFVDLESWGGGGRGEGGRGGGEGGREEGWEEDGVILFVWVCVREVGGGWGGCFDVCM